MLDADLAELYGVPVKHLKRAVKRNRDRFPADFMFQLTQKERSILRCQIGTLRWGAHSKYFPFVFTEQGVAMLSSVLRSRRASHVNIAIMRTFVSLRHGAKRDERIARILRELGKRVDSHDARIEEILAILRGDLGLEEKPRKQIGFRLDG